MTWGVWAARTLGLEMRGALRAHLPVLVRSRIGILAWMAQRPLPLRASDSLLAIASVGVVILAMTGLLDRWGLTSELAIGLASVALALAALVRRLWESRHELTVGAVIDELAQTLAAWRDDAEAIRARRAGDMAKVVKVRELAQTLDPATASAVLEALGPDPDADTTKLEGEIPR